MVRPVVQGRAVPQSPTCRHSRSCIPRRRRDPGLRARPWCHGSCCRDTAEADASHHRRFRRSVLLPRSYVSCWVALSTPCPRGMGVRSGWVCSSGALQAHTVTHTQSGDARDCAGTRTRRSGEPHSFRAAPASSRAPRGLGEQHWSTDTPLLRVWWQRWMPRLIAPPLHPPPPTAPPTRQDELARAPAARQQAG